MVITVRLDQETERKLKYLLEDINKEPKGYADQTISDIVRLAIDNQWVATNTDHVYYEEENECDPVWAEKYLDAYKKQLSDL